MNGADVNKRVYIDIFKSVLEKLKEELIDIFARGQAKREWSQSLHYSLDYARNEEIIFDFGFARDDRQDHYDLPESGNCIFVKSLNGSCTLKVSFGEGYGPGEEYELFEGQYIKCPFKKLWLSNVAQAEKSLVLVIGRGEILRELSTEKREAEINNYGILEFDLMFPRDDEKHEINARQLQLLEKPHDNWSIKLNTNKNPALEGSLLDPFDVINGDGAIPGYWKYLYFTNEESSGIVKFLVGRSLPYRAPTPEEEEGALKNPESDPTYPPTKGWPSFTIWKSVYSLEDSYWRWTSALNLGGGNAILAAGANTSTGGSTRRIYKTEDYGKTWSVLATTSQVPSEIFIRTRLVKISDKEFGIGQGGMGTGVKANFYKSTDYGETWSRYTIKDRGESIYFMDIVYLGNNVVLAWLRWSLSVSDRGIWRSTNKGVNWTHITVGNANGDAWFCDLGGGVVLLSQADKTILKSQDYGETWSTVATMPATPWRFIYLGNDIVIQGCTNGDIYKSTDGGETWTYIDTLSSKVNAFEQYGTGKILALCSDCTLYKSEDYGGSWQALGKPEGVTTGYILKALAVGEMIGVFDDGKIYKPE